MVECKTRETTREGGYPRQPADVAAKGYRIKKPFSFLLSKKKTTAWLFLLKRAPQKYKGLNTIHSSSIDLPYGGVALPLWNCAHVGDTTRPIS